MTRHNWCIDPSELCDMHLIAEYHEMFRDVDRTPKGDIPDTFTLGTGHCNFVATYQATLKARVLSVYAEMQYRGMNVSVVPTFKVHAYDKNWLPNNTERLYVRRLLIDRLVNRMRITSKPLKWTNRPIPVWWEPC